MAKPKKGDVVEALEKAGIVFDPEATLEVLMPLYDALPKEESEEKEEEEAEEETEEDEEEEADGDSVTVLARNGQAIRTYTKTLHGKDFRKLAKEFTEKIRGSIQ